MKNMYLFCSIIILGIVSVCFSCLMYSEVKVMKNSISEAHSISDRLNDQNNRLELAVNELEQNYEALGTLDVSGSGINAYPGITENNDDSEEAYKYDNSSEDYLIILQGKNIMVYCNNSDVPIFSVSVESSILTEEQKELLENGIHIKELSQVYSLLESYSS